MKRTDITPQTTVYAVTSCTATNPGLPLRIQVYRYESATDYAVAA